MGILINKRLSFKLISRHPDKYGRYLVVRCELFGEIFTPINVYNNVCINLYLMSFLRKIQTVLDQGSLYLGEI